MHPGSPPNPSMARDFANSTPTPEAEYRSTGEGEDPKLYRGPTRTAALRNTLPVVSQFGQLQIPRAILSSRRSNELEGASHVYYLYKRLAFSQGADCQSR